MISPIDTLSRFGVNHKAVAAFDVLCLPENISTATKKEDLHDTDDSAFLCKLLKHNGVTVGTSIDLGLKVPVLTRRGGEIWLGTVWILKEVALPIFVNVLSSLIAGRRKPKVEPSPQSLRPEKKINVKMMFVTKRGLASIEYEGPPQALSGILSGMSQEDPPLEQSSET